LKVFFFAALLVVVAVLQYLDLLLSFFVEGLLNALVVHF